MKKITKLVSTTITAFSSDSEKDFEKNPQKTKVTRNQDICGDLLGVDMLFHNELQKVSEQTPEDGKQLQPEMVLMDRVEIGDRSKSNIACICMSACLGALHQSNPSSEVSRDH